MCRQSLYERVCPNEGRCKYGYHVAGTVPQYDRNERYDNRRNGSDSIWNNDNRNRYENDRYEKNDNYRRSNNNNFNSEMKDFLGEMVKKEFWGYMMKKRDPQDLREILRGL